MSNALEIASRREGEKAAVLSLAGEVDVANTPQMRDAALQLISAGVVRLVIDLSATEYMDSAGLGTLVGLRKRLRESGGELLLAAPKPRVRRLLDITGLDQILAVHEDVAAALKEDEG